MTTHYDELSVAPDPARAEELRQRLHARLARRHTAASVSITPADTDPDAEEGDLIMLETEDRTADGQPPTPSRRWPGTWLLVAAAVAVVAIVGALLVAADGDDDGDQLDTASTTPTTAPERFVTDLEPSSDLEPGHYLVDPDLDATTPLVVSFDVAAEGWAAWSGTYKSDGSGQEAVNITTVENVVDHPCNGHTPVQPPLGPSVDDLANALATLQVFEVTAPPSDVTMLGYEGKHLQLTVPEDLSVADCTEGHLESWIGPNGPFSGYHDGERGRTEDFWILDVDGQRLVIETNAGPTSSEQDLAEQAAIFDSIRIRP